MAVARLYHKGIDVPDSIEIGAPDYIGGEGTVFFSRDGEHTVKVYHEQDGLPTKRKLLEKIILVGARLTAEEKHFLCWPLALVASVDGHECVGCVTRRIPTPPYTPLVNVILTPKHAAAQFRSDKSWAHYVQMAIGIAHSVATLHRKGCIHADLHFRNFLVNPSDNDVVLLDLDGLVVPGFLPPQVAGLPGFMAPEVIMGTSVPNQLSDQHSLAVLVLHTLLFRNVLQPLITYDADSRDNDERNGWGKEVVFNEYARDQRQRPKLLGAPLSSRGTLSYRMLTPALQRLTKRALIEGLHDPSERPLAQEWLEALSHARDELTSCSACGLHFPYPYWLTPLQRRACPFCGQRVAPPLPSVLLVYELRSMDVYRFTNRCLVVNSGWELSRSVLNLQPARISGLEQSSIGHVEWDAKHRINRLVNDESATWYARTGEDGSETIIRSGSSIALQRGTTINFEDRRLMLVKE